MVSVMCPASLRPHTHPLVGGVGGVGGKRGRGHGAERERAGDLESWIWDVCLQRNVERDGRDRAGKGERRRAPIPSWGYGIAASHGRIEEGLLLAKSDADGARGPVLMARGNSDLKWGS